MYQVNFDVERREVYWYSYFQNFLVVYIKLGFPRMPPEKQIECIPVLIDCIEDGKTTEQLKNSLVILFRRLWAKIWKRNKILA